MWLDEKKNQASKKIIEHFHRISPTKQLSQVFNSSQF